MILFVKSTHAVFNMLKCEDGHFLVCMLDNKANLLSYILAPLIYMEVLGQRDA